MGAVFTTARIAALGLALLVAAVAFRSTRPAPRPADSYSNITAHDYVGPGACSRCHAKRHRTWQTSSHRSMTRMAGDPGVILGDFGDIKLEYGGGHAMFEQRGSHYFMTLAGPQAPARRFRITRTIGWRHLQEYVGVQEDGPEPSDHRAYATEIRLPFGYWLRKRAWFHRQYFDSWYPAEYMNGELAVDPFKPDDTPWATRCAWCHNTFPLEIAMRRDLTAPIGHGRHQFFEFTAAADAAPLTDNLLPTNALTTVGISCESCHLGGREHADNDKPIRFVPTAPHIRKRRDAPDLSAGRASSAVINATCAQCHSTPSPRYADGSLIRNSSEALDMAGGHCSSVIKCTDCHDPHVRGPGPNAPDNHTHIQACINCHPALADSAVAKHHSGHAPQAASCLDCHMPRIVQGINAYVRSHHISSPTAISMLAAGGPNACNLCHLDKSIQWTLNQLDRRWARTIVPGAAWAESYNGDLDAPVGPIWLRSPKPSRRLAAAHAYARSGLGASALPNIISVMNDPVAHDRMWTLFAVEDIVGRVLSIDEYAPMAPPSDRASQTQRLLQRPPR